ncbi:hypothetical protein EB118_03550 [bacterium]|nr:hypothetical protein [bacterium]NDC94055.1 hypothetical protein [bacterium]NDD82741.1 hypothetical protein [bacterium]NDG29161.1 hypothetical protein [bacterium]
MQTVNAIAVIITLFGILTLYYVDRLQTLFAQSTESILVPHVDKVLGSLDSDTRRQLGVVTKVIDLQQVYDGKNVDFVCRTGYFKSLLIVTTTISFLIAFYSRRHLADSTKMLFVVVVMIAALTQHQFTNYIDSQAIVDRFISTMASH